MKLTFTASFKTTDGTPQDVSFKSEDFATEAEAREEASRFPKSYNFGVVRHTPFNSPEPDSYRVVSNIRFTTAKGNAVNETGIKRTLKIISKANTEFKKGPFLNSYEVEGEFITAIKEQLGA